MTTAASALVKIAVEEYAAGDYAGAIALADPLLRWDDRALSADGELTWGTDDVLEAVRRWAETWDEYSAEILELEQIGDRYVAAYRERGIEAGTEVERDQLRAAVITVENGRIVGWARYLSPEEAMRVARAAGEVERFS